MLIADTLSKFAADLKYETVPPPVRERAKHLMLDAIGIAFASGKYEFSRRALSGIRRLGEGDADVIGFSTRLQLRDSVLMNGLLVHGLDYDDTYLPGSIHLTASSVPTALGMSAHVGTSGRNLLTACVLGLESGARLAVAGKGGFQQAGFHPTGVCGAFASALIAGRLMELTPQQLTMAQGIALSTAAGSMQPIRDGSWTKRMHPGWAGAAGITAASMARGGFVGPAAAYEGRFGFYTMYLGNEAANADMSLVTANLGENWEFPRASIKLYPAGHLSHAFMNAAIKLVREHRINPKEVQFVRTLVAKTAVPLICEPAETKRRPTSSYMAQFSLPYAMACCLTRGRFGLAEIEEASFNNPDLIALAEKVEYEIDPNSSYPKFRSGEVIIKMKDGRELRRRENILPDEPAPNETIVAKFMDNAQLVMPDARAKAIRDMVLAMEDEPDARRISRALGGN
ncbi:MAG: MmgE/PrpD family protein [Betaproteobacteria bacterium]|nr:MmgE/PrpD family protein [Betaproteobacteria bacterium]